MGNKSTTSRRTAELAATPSWRALAGDAFARLLKLWRGSEGSFEAPVATGAEKESPRTALKNKQSCKKRLAPPPEPSRPPEEVDEDPYQNKKRYEEFCEARISDDKAGAEKNLPEEPRRARGNQAWYNKRSSQPSKIAAVAAAPPPPPPRVPVIVDGEVVPNDVVSQYADYCIARSGCPRDSSICHLCIFDMQRCPKSTVGNSKMIHHCWDMHRTSADQVCRETGCKVIVATKRDLVLHTHFCHKLNAGWWMKYTC